MRLLPRFREDRILREQVAVIARNMRVGLGGSWITAVLGTWGRPGLAPDAGQLAWFGAYSALMALALLLHAAIAREAWTPRRSATALVLLFAAIGVAWGWLPLRFLGSVDPFAMLVAIALVAGISAGVLTMNAPILPVYLAYVTTALPMLGIACFAAGGPLAAVGWGTVVYVIVTIAFAAHSERAIKEAIELRFENTELVARLKDAMARAEAARDEALAANAAKSRFLAAASHDLRQPAHALGLLLDVLGRSELTEHQANVHRNLVGAAQATRDMLNTLLDFSRIEAGVLQPQVRDFGLQPLFARVEGELALESDARGLLYRTRDTTLAVRSDPALVELVLRNLVSNAIRYTERGGILVAARRRGEQVVLEVWDTGIGIAPDKQAEVFREFHQLGNPERDRRKGLGLGLAISDGIARLLGQPLRLSSRPGRGSVFRLALPKALDALAGHGESAAPDPDKRLRARLLVIDDDEHAREALRTLLESWGAACDAVESIDKALSSVRTAAPDLVISDYRLQEERTGGEAVAAIRRALGNRVPAILVTGDTAPERLREAAAADAVLLHKPVPPRQLRAAIDALLAPTGRTPTASSAASTP